jgi:uncharacterized protein YktB (UPF0637 family)
VTSKRQFRTTTQIKAKARSQKLRAFFLGKMAEISTDITPHLTVQRGGEEDGMQAKIAKGKRTTIWSPKGERSEIDNQELRTENWPE